MNENVETIDLDRILSAISNGEPLETTILGEKMLVYAESVDLSNFQYGPIKIRVALSFIEVKELK